MWSLWKTDRVTARLAVFALFVLAACSPSLPSVTQATQVIAKTTEPSATYTPVPGAAAVQDSPLLTPGILWIDDRLPSALRAGVKLKAGVLQTPDGEQANLKLTFETGQVHLAAAQLRWIYVLAARFPTIGDNVTMGSLQQVWKGGDGKGHVLLLDQETQAVFSILWGLPGAGSVQILPADGLLDAAWKNPRAWALIPFEALEPRWKVLRVDGFSVLERDLDAEAYPLTLKVGLYADGSVEARAKEIVLPESNREPQKLVILAMTGTTALVRKTAQMMNERGVTYPAKDIGALLRSADLTHISNEVSFDTECSPARAASGEGIFCSAPDYIKLLDAVGTDIIELTGNHNLDKGEAGYLFSLEVFQKRNWAVYGGGLNLEKARLPLKIERGETRLALLGCNMAGPDIAWATKEHPGAATCSIDQMDQTIRQLRGDGYLPVVTFQAFETEDYMPMPMQQPSDFTRMAEAGAVVVSGSQAHFPQGFAFRPGSIIHFGLGNLFFDQVEPISIRRAFIDWHVFYGGKYLGVVLVTVMQEDFGRPRLMTAEERAMFLEDVFQANGWKP